MGRRAAAGIVVGIVVGLAACGGAAEEPLLGVWTVASHTHGDAGCAAQGPAVADPPFVQFQRSDVLGQEVVELVDCTTPTSCAASAGLAGRLFTESLPAGGLRAEVFTSFGGEADCALAASRTDAVVADDDSLRIEARTYETRDLSGVVCAPATARALFASLTCKTLDVLTAVR